MRPGLCHLFPLRPAPQGHTRWWGALGGAGGIPPTAETPGHLLGTACGRGLHLRRCGARGLLVNGKHPYPHPHPPRGGSCVRACVCAGGGAVSPLSPETPASSEPGSSGWAPSQLSPRKDGSPLIHPNQEVLETSAPPKDLQCPRSLFSLSSPQKPFLISLWIHCLFALLITSIPTHILSASPQCQGPETPGLCHLCPLGHPQASPREVSE